MARDDDAIDESDEELDENLAPFSLDSYKAIQQSRKGKPHRFVLVRKGARVGCLIVFLRGGIDQRIKAAKKVSSGRIFFGAVTGKGNNVTFRLSRADGFEKEPVKKNMLRDFLDDEAGLSLKVDFEIVDRLDAEES